MTRRRVSASIVLAREPMEVLLRFAVDGRVTQYVMGEDDSKRPSARVSDLLAERLKHFLKDPSAGTGAALPSEQAAHLEAVLGYKSPSYREAFAIQVAYGLLKPGLDLTQRPAGGRSVAAQFARMLKENHIKASSDAFQNIGKNAVDLCRGNVPEFDALLRWATAAEPTDLGAALNCAMAGLARTARPVEPMPDLDVPVLTFYRVGVFFDELLDCKSGGAYDQFTIAALLEALIQEVGATGPAGLRVDTKHIHASDASAGTAGDVEIRHGGRVEESFEVSANDWRLKLDQARNAIRTADLLRTHVVARVGEKMISQLTELSDLDEDVSVLEIRSFVRVLVAVLRKPGRVHALSRLYELLDRNQPDVDLVNIYVKLVRQHGLAR